MDGYSFTFIYGQLGSDFDVDDVHCIWDTGAYLHCKNRRRSKAKNPKSD